MLKKKERLTRTEFNRSFSVAKRIHTPYVQILVTPSPTFHGSVVVGKKIYKKAVDRNRLRRQIYGFLYRFQTQEQMQKTIILIAKPALIGVSVHEVLATLKEGLLKAKSMS